MNHQYREGERRANGGNGTAGDESGGHVPETDDDPYRDYNYESHWSDGGHYGMARMGAFNPKGRSDPGDIRTLTLYVYRETNGPAPHFHFYRGKDRKTGGCIMLDDAKYSPHERHTDAMDQEETRRLLEFLDSTDPDMGVSIWRLMLMAWNMLNPDSKVSMNAPTPGYHYNMPAHE